jgi:hypothetical protein
MTHASHRDGDPGSHGSRPKDADLLPIRSSSGFLGPGILAYRLLHKPSIPSQPFFIMIDNILSANHMTRNVMVRYKQQVKLILLARAAKRLTAHLLIFR